MAFEGLTQRLQQAFGKVRGKGSLTEEDVKLVMREVRMALLEADVNYKVVKDFVKKATERCIGQEAQNGLSTQQQVIKIVNEELTELMGGSNARLQYSSSPIAVFMLCGLQGAGQTTMSAKLANWLKRTASVRCLSAAISIVRRPSSSCRSSAVRSACRSMNTVRRTRSRRRRKRLNTPVSISATW